MPLERSTGLALGCSGVCARVTTPIDDIRPAKRTRDANRTCLLTSKTKWQLSRNRCFKSGKTTKTRQIPHLSLIHPRLQSSESGKELRGSLCELCVSVVAVFPGNFTTE